MLIKKLLIFIIILPLVCINVSSLDGNELSARAAVVIESETNSVIFNKNITEKLSMASTTKIMTAIIAIESGMLGYSVTAKEDVLCEGTSIGIKKGDSFTLETLVWALMLESGNDAAVLIAEFLAGTEADFSVLMNNKALEIGMRDTNFVTASGLDDEEHFTTAYDMAVLASYAIKNPIFKRICSSEKYTASYISPEITETYTNHNKLLKMYDGVFGVKTGFTKKSGRCLISACERNGATLVAVTLKAPDDWNDHIKLYDYCYSMLKSFKNEIQLPGTVKVYGSEIEYIEIDSEEEIFYSAYGDEAAYIVLLPRFVYAPVKKYDNIGKIIILIDGEKYKEINIKACTDVQSTYSKIKPEYTFLDKLKNIFR